MEEKTSLDKAKDWIEEHPRPTAVAMLVVTGTTGFIVGRKLQNFLIDRFITGFEDTIQDHIDEYGQALIKVTKQGYTWTIKNTE